MRNNSLETLYNRDNYLDTSVPYIISEDIVEYDMSDAGFSIIKEHKLLDQKTMDYLASLPKKRRHVTVGLMMKDNKEFAKKHRHLLREHRKIFIQDNELNEENILSIKSDAIFTRRRCNNLVYGEIEFKEKHIYTSYYYLNRKEIYVGHENIDIKGIREDDLDPHREFFMKELWSIMKLIETGSKESIVRRLTAFIKKYKRRELPIEMYRELRPHGMYKLNINMGGAILASSDLGDVNMIDISYNYFRYIVPLIELMI